MDGEMGLPKRRKAFEAALSAISFVANLERNVPRPKSRRKHRPHDSTIRKQESVEAAGIETEDVGTNLQQSGEASDAKTTDDSVTNLRQSGEESDVKTEDSVTSLRHASKIVTVKERCRRNSFFLEFPSDDKLEPDALENDAFYKIDRSLPCTNKRSIKIRPITRGRITEVTIGPWRFDFPGFETD